MPTPQQFSSLRKNVAVLTIRTMAVVEFERRFSGLAVPDEDRLAKMKRLPIDLHPETYGDLGMALVNLGEFLLDIDRVNHEGGLQVAQAEGRPPWPLFDPTRTEGAARAALAAQAVINALWSAEEVVVEVDEDILEEARGER